MFRCLSTITWKSLREEILTIKILFNILTKNFNLYLILFFFKKKKHFNNQPLVRNYLLQILFWNFWIHQMINRTFYEDWIIQLRSSQNSKGYLLIFSRNFIFCFNIPLYHSFLGICLYNYYRLYDLKCLNKSVDIFHYLTVSKSPIS